MEFNVNLPQPTHADMYPKPPEFDQQFGCRVLDAFYIVQGSMPDDEICLDQN